MAYKKIKKAKVLIAEDNIAILRVISNKLRRRGIDVIEANNGIEALIKIREKPSLVLLDLIMPEKDGFGVLEDVKNKKDYQKIPIIILSNLGQNSDIKKAKDLGAFDYIVKSNMSINSIVAMVEERLAKFNK